MSDNPVYIQFQQDADRREAIRLEIQDEAQRVADAAEAERAALLASEHAAEQAKADEAERIRAEFSEAEPPDGHDDLSGLPPQRGRLDRYRKWLAQLTADHANLVAGRSQHLADMGVKVATKAELDALIQADTTGLLAAMRQGLSAYQIRSHERAQLEKKLVSDTHQAEVSRLALDKIEAEIDATATAIEVVKGRENEFVADALQEHLVETTGADIIGQAEALRLSILTALGAHGAIRRLRGVSHFAQPVSLQLPTPRLAGEKWHTASEDKPGYGTGLASGYELSFPVHLQDQEQRRWSDMAKQLAADPRADLSGPKL